MIDEIIRNCTINEAEIMEPDLSWILFHEKQSCLHFRIDYKEYKAYYKMRVVYKNEGQMIHISRQYGECVFAGEELTNNQKAKLLEKVVEQKNIRLLWILEDENGTSF